MQSTGRNLICERDSCPPKTTTKLLGSMPLIRRFEEKADIYPDQKMKRQVHPCHGAGAAGVPPYSFQCKRRREGAS